MRWTWKVGDTDVVAEMNTWTGKRTVHVGDRELRKEQGGLRAIFGGEIDGRDTEVVIGLKLGFVPTATLHVAREEVALLEGPHPMPFWAWVFIAACAAIVVVAKGGAIPGALAGGGGAGCFYAAIGGPRSVVARMVICAAITGAAWGAYLGLVAALTS